MIPILNDWESADALCAQLDFAFSQFTNYRVTVIFVDDGSRTKPILPALQRCSAFETVKILRLKRNMGHQRAIALGLAYVQEQVACDTVLVMDGDGQDKPEDVPRLLDALERGEAEVIFAERGRRLEGPIFRACYLFYKILHRILTGRKIQFGNFSVLRFAALRSLTVMPEMWSHYAASVVLARIPFSKIRVDRGIRLRGSSKMNFDALVLHGLAAIALYPTTNVRVLIGSIAASIATGLFAAAVVTIRLATHLAIPGWTTTMVGICLTLLCVAMFISLLCVFMTAGFRTLLGVLPIRDYSYFIDSCKDIHGPTIQRQ